MNDTAGNIHEVYERARLSRDARFDGRFFVGVRTTGIYCRPVCPANPPRSENVVFFPTAAAAGEAGFRPCLRCRPECAPGTPAWAGTSTTVQRGLRLIAEGALDDGNVESLAARLGVTSRHLRRLFTRHLGASPQSVARTQRLHFAKRLIDDTGLPLSSISSAAGYGSVRRFNDSFQKAYGRSPRELRGARRSRVDVGALAVRLACRPPFDWSSILRFFSARAIPGVECIEGDRYLRAIEVDGRPGVLDVGREGSRVELRLHGIETKSLFGAVQRVRDLFDLDAPVTDIAAVLTRDELLRDLVDAQPGIRVPGAWDGFELTVRAILGQQVSVQAATTMAGRIAERYGEPVEIAVDGVIHVPQRLFPRPERLQRARLEHLGVIRSRAAAIRAVARAVVLGELAFDGAVGLAALREALLDIRGIGDWTTEYVAMRALKDPDAFPASDLGLLRAVSAPGERRARPTELLARAEAWRPWRAYGALLVWSAPAGAGG
jgi:AraC family transcriptional regulator of adaptative response / DNA-3-methyladenine glycosylase II